MLISGRCLRPSPHLWLQDFLWGRMLRDTQFPNGCNVWCLRVKTLVPSLVDAQSKALDERTQICHESLSAQGKLWPVDEPRCDLTHVRHQSIRVSVSVTLCVDHSTC